jgi:hypothetical protein
VFGFVFMSVPLFNLIVVNERALLGSSFNYYADRYLENIIRHGATRCFAFQATVLVTGVLALITRRPRAHYSGLWRRCSPGGPTER